MTPPDDFPGDELALRLDRHSEFLRSLARRLVRHESDANGAVQNTFAAAAALLVGVGLYGAMTQLGTHGHLEAPSEAAAAPGKQASPAAAALARSGDDAAGRTQVAGVGENVAGALVTAAAAGHETLTIVGTIEDLGIDQEPVAGSGASAISPPGFANSDGRRHRTHEPGNADRELAGVTFR